jgi:DNA-binding protein HU-beta
MSMNKSDIVSAVAQSSGVAKKDVERVLNATIDAMSQALIRGEKVQLSGFGTFEVKTRQARVGRNPHTKEQVHIPATRVPQFKPSQGLKENVAK